MARRKIDEYRVVESRAGITPEYLRFKKREESRLLAGLGLAKQTEARQKRAQTLTEVGFAGEILSGRSIYGVMIKWFFIISIILIVVIGPGLGVITQMTKYLSKTVVFWILGLGVLILWLRRR